MKFSVPVALAAFALIGALAAAAVFTYSGFFNTDTSDCDNYRPDSMYGAPLRCKAYLDRKLDHRKQIP
jgi:hypothetical protein